MMLKQQCSHPLQCKTAIGARCARADCAMHHGATIIPSDLCPSVAEQKRKAEEQAGGPCFRMWLTRAEFDAANFADWHCYELVDGRLAIWRQYADLRRLRNTRGAERVYEQILERRIDDDGLI